MDKAKDWGATALNMLAAPLFSNNRRDVIERAGALRLPAIYEWPEIAEEGSLIAYGPPLPMMYRQAARLIVEVFQGAKPEENSSLAGQEHGRTIPIDGVIGRRLVDS